MTCSIGKHGFRLVLVVVSATVLAMSAAAQRIAVLAPDDTPKSVSFAEQLVRSFEPKVRVIDSGVARAAFDSVKVENAFNLTAEQARSIGTVIGCDYFVLVKAATSRRTSS